jgi:hypothetical protein
MRVRLTVCSRCGHEGRLVIATPELVISRCHLCGDELRSETPVRVAQVRGVPVAERIRVMTAGGARSA